VSERNPVAVKAVQVVLGSLTVLLVYLLGRAWFDERTGWLAGLLTALYPNLVAFTHLLWSETLFIFLLLGLFLVLVRRLELPGRGTCLAAGVLLGLSALTRSSIAYFALPLVAWMIWIQRESWREGALRALLVLLAAGAVIAPWTYRNQGIHDGFVFLDTNAPYNLWRGNHPTSFTNRYEEIVPHYEWPFDDIPVHPVARQGASMLVNQTIVETKNMQPTDLEVTRYATHAARRFIREQPMTFIRRIRYRMIDMWNPTSFMIRHLRLEAYGEVSPLVKTSLTLLAMVSYGVVLPLGLIGLALAWRDPRIWLVAALIAFLNAITMLAFGLTRFRIPLMPFFMIGASHAIWYAVGVWRRRRSPAE
jgi:4-amino-4-deoxy-L-arabinose transferase-like glycosyltransferase